MCLVLSKIAASLFCILYRGANTEVWENNLKMCIMHSRLRKCCPQTYLRRGHMILEAGMGYHWRAPRWAEGLCGHFANRRPSVQQQPERPAQQCIILSIKERTVFAINLIVLFQIAYSECDLNPACCTDTHHRLTMRGDLESIIDLNACFWTVAGHQSSMRKPTYTWGGHSNSYTTVYPSQKM